MSGLDDTAVYYVECYTHCCKQSGGLAQLVEHLLCKQGVNGSNPLFSTFKEIIDMVGTQNEKIKRFY